jgi:hypothetical protein
MQVVVLGKEAMLRKSYTNTIRDVTALVNLAKTMPDLPSDRILAMHKASFGKPWWSGPSANSIDTMGYQGGPSQHAQSTKRNQIGKWFPSSA